MGLIPDFKALAKTMNTFSPMSITQGAWRKLFASVMDALGDHLWKVPALLGDGTPAGARHLLGLDNAVLEYTNRGDWKDDADYSTNDMVWWEGSTYAALVPHHSGQSFRADLEAGKWRAIGGDLFERLSAPEGSSLVGFIQRGADAVPRRGQDKYRDIVSVKDYGATGDYAANDTDGIVKAYNVVPAPFFPAGKFRNSVTEPRLYYGPGVPVTLSGEVAKNFNNVSGIGVESFDALGAFPADTPPGLVVKSRMENLSLVVLPPSDTNAVFDFSDVGGAKFTYLDGIVTDFCNGAKPSAYSLAQADAMSADFSAMVGYAAVTGTTGGGRGPVYWVTNTSDDIYTTGSLRWAINQVRTAGSGRVLFHPRGNFEVYLTSQIILPSNITIDAPGRNARIWAPTDVTRFKLIDCANVVVRRLQFSSTPGATATMRDGIWIVPDSVDRVWIDQCSFRYAGDGCIDMSTLVEMENPCRVTVSRCLFRQHDKGMLLGSLACYNPNPPAWCPTASPANTRLFVTLIENYYDSVGQRQPKAISQTFVDSINNVHRMCQQNRDDGSFGSAYGILTATGGSARSRGDLFISALGTGWSGVDAWRDPQKPLGGGTGATDGPGCIDYTTDTVALDGVKLAKYNEGLVPVPPYAITPKSIPTSNYARRKWAQMILSNAGAEFDTAADGQFRWDRKSVETPNGFNVISETPGSGRWLRVDKINEAPAFANMVPPSRTINTPRSPTLRIASHAITVPDTGTFFAIDTEGQAASDTLTTINGGSDGRWIMLRSASSGRTVTVMGGGNIAVPETYPLSANSTVITLMYEPTVGKWLTIEKLPTYGSAWNGTTPFKLGNYYLWVDTSQRLRIKNSAPASDTDGIVVGSQS
ncbi:hypothetical protein E1956_13930 [Paraburkholderia pallida]|uniref:Pectate lyase domain-containing protein n=1 Tax=Paraburkholderia pallida TaxID=2547399 RepID=A0A4P7CVG0_9BURK|nr:hypothetical protein [Paraburkholderia pallida]QBQ98164.1 hypothetical protein E1956_13930 [Paraburkholderia pallida]